MEAKLFMPIKHAGLTVGYIAEGFGLNMREMACAERADIKAHSLYNNKRSFSVHVAGEPCGQVHYITGGRYVGLDTQGKEVANCAGSDAEIRCFAEVAQAAGKDAE